MATASRHATQANPTEEFNPIAVAKPGHNQPPPDIFSEIDDLFEEAKNWADGEPITSDEMHDAITALYDGLHDAGKRADELRKAEKKPHDDAAAAVQAKFNPYIQPKRGKVDMGKSALGDLLAKWRAEVQRKKAAEAARIAEEAERARREAEDAIRANSASEAGGDLASRVDAEEKLAHAKSLEKTAKRAGKAATTGSGLRTVWVAELVDEFDALEWAWTRDEERFKALVQEMANAAVRGGARAVPGFVVREEKVAA